MKVVVYNFKGGVGKTAISLNLALETGWGVVANEQYSPIEDALPEGSFIKVEHNKDFPVIPEDMDVIYDLGGYPEKRVIPVLEECDVIFIPTYTDSSPDIKVTKKTISELLPFNKNIYIIANKSTEKEAQAMTEALELPVLTLPTSKGFKRIYTDRKSIRQQTEGNKLLAHSYRNVIAKFDKILDIVQGVTV
ncbi:MAG: hypothetical protein HRT88_19090 [Lentisphaeraceae bacterium]|nr:hypothetical protein [Lentisphaeraceae bacterium]